MPTPLATTTATMTVSTMSRPTMGCFFLMLGLFFIEREATDHLQKPVHCNIGARDPVKQHKFVGKRS